MPTPKNDPNRRFGGKKINRSRKPAIRPKREWRPESPLLELERSRGSFKLRARGLVAYLVSVALIAGSLGYLIYHVT